MSLRNQKIRVLVGSIPLPGHFTPLIRIVQAMNESQEFQIVFATSQFALQELNLSPKIKKLGLKDETKIITQQFKIDKMISAYYDEVWYQQISSFIEEFKPNVIVSDFFAPSFVKMGKKFGIPTVIHSPSPLNSIMPFADFPLISKSVSIFGLIINFNNILKHILPKMIKQMIEFGPQLINSFVMFSSFFGIQDAYSLPPNFKMIGFTLPRDQSESKIQGDLKIWIQDKINNNKDIMYVSVGTLLKMPQNFIDFLYEGLKKMDIAVIWSMKQGNIPEQNPNFFVREWLPQWEILKMKEIKLMITHCGWGGISECIQGCKPMLCMPNSADQTMNAKTVVDKGLGLILRQQKKILLSPQLLDQFRFTHQELEQKINILRRNQSYTKRLEKLQSIMMAQTGGCKQAVNIIRNAANQGIDHLIDRNVEKLQKKSILPLISFLFISIILYLLWSIFIRDVPTQTL